MWHRRMERRQQVSWDADNLMALFGDNTSTDALGRT